MVRLADAISKIRVNGKNVKEIPQNRYAIMRILKSTMKEEPLNLKSRLNLDVYVSPRKTPETAQEMVRHFRGMMDSCGDWAPWSKISRMQNK